MPKSCKRTNLMLQNPMKFRHLKKKQTEQPDQADDAELELETYKNYVRDQFSKMEQTLGLKLEEVENIDDQVENTEFNEKSEQNEKLDSNEAAKQNEISNSNKHLK